MTSTLLVAVAALPALADVSPVTGKPEPTSNVASNIAPSNTRSEIAPALPAPASEGPRDLLMTASQNIASRRTGAAQEALERAETRILDRSVPATMSNAPDNSQVVNLIAQARMALANNDLQSANASVQQALQALPPEGQSVPQGSNVIIAPGAPPPPGAETIAPPGAGIIDRNVAPAEVVSIPEPGHWELQPDGRYVWHFPGSN